jgi:hypothetical protein
MTTAAEKQADEAIRVALEFAECNPKLPEMIDIVFLEAHRIEGSERARLMWGDRERPHEDQIERIAKLHAVMRFLEACRDEPERAIRWLRKQAQNGKA